MNKRVIYEPDLGLEGTVEELVNWAERYTNDYSNPALKRISELAEEEKMEEKYIQIPLLLKTERIRENNADKNNVPYERLKIDWFNYGKISYSKSNYGTLGTELEIYSEGDKVLIVLIGMDENGTFTAAGSFSIKEFMNGDYGWLDSAIGSVLYYAKEYEEVSE